MVSIDDLKELTLYRKPYYLPIDMKDKKHGSAIILMTPNYKSSMLAMTAPYAVNKKYFESYYIEKSITRYIQNESVFDTEDLGEYIFEEVSDISRENASEETYVNEFINNHAFNSIHYKMSGSNNFYFTGYKKDIDTVKKYVSKSSITECFDRLETKCPVSKVNIIVTNNHDVSEEFTKDSVVVYTPNAFKKKGGFFDYKYYIKYILQLYAIYTLKPANNFYHRNPGKILDSLAEPAAILLSGIANEDLSIDKTDRFGVERIYKYIIDNYGMSVFTQMIASNDVDGLFKYTKEYGQYKFSGKLTEDFDLINEESEISIEDPVPESIKALQRIGTTLKRRIRQHSVYKLNKIKRDMERGNVGTETREINSVQQLQLGNMITTPTNTTMEQLQRWTDGDYIVEGNYVYLFEDSSRYDMQIRRALFKDRFKSSRQVLNVYKQVKNDLPFIRYAFTDIPRYQNRNIFIDLSYYNESFFRNMDDLNQEDKNNNSRIFKIYIELMERLLSDNRISSYSKKTIYIPVLDWRHNNSMKMWMYKEDINPISAIYYLMKYDYTSLKRVFGNNDIIFLGGKNYFKINLSKVDCSKQSNISKFTTLVNRLIKLGYDSPADPDPAGELEDSPSGIAMDLVDKVEKSQNISINNVSRFATLKKSVDLIQQPQSSAETISSKAVKKIPVSVDNKNEVIGKISTVTVGKMNVNDASPSGKIINVPIEVDKKIVTTAAVKADTLKPSDTKSVNSTSEEDKKDAIVDAIAKAANDSNSVDNALNNLDTDEFKAMILSIQNDSEENVRVDKVRASKVVAIQDEFHKKEVAGRSVQDLLNADNTKEDLPKSSLDVSSINEEWKNLTFMNFDKEYDTNSDILKMLDSMQNWTFPVAVKNIDIKDNSTSEDIIDLWTIECIDSKNTRFTIRVDVPKFINGSNFLKLRGNEKVLMIQSALLPIIKTGLSECQIIGTGGYNKIFVRRFGSRKGQSNPASSRIIRSFNKYMQKFNKIKVVLGNNMKVCTKYELPIDYIDLSQVFNTIESDNIKIYFNQDELRSEYEVDDTKGIPIGIRKTYSSKEKKVIEIVEYFKGDYSITMSNYIASILCEEDEDFNNIYSKIQSSGSRYTYSKASILNSEIPVVIVCAYHEGLISTMNKAGIEYQFVQELDKSSKYLDNLDYIRFSDGYLLYKVNYSSSLLLNGLKENDTESYSIKDINNRRMYMEFLNNYSNGLVTDGLENSYDCMIDPITKEILEKYKLPTDYIGLLIHANNILADNKYIKHIDQSGRRWRRKELIAGYFYKALSESYRDYANSMRHNRKNSKMTMKQSAIIDLLLSRDPSTSDLSVNSALNDIESINSVTNKGLVGMNSTRGYVINTRGYDDSMLNILGMDTGFSGNVGINRQATVNANIEGGRGFIKTIDNDVDKLSTTSSFTMTEALTPLGCTHDDPQRSLMTYVQTSKHMVRCDNNDPTLITTGADEALPYMVSDIFSYKAKKDGKIVELVEEGFGKKNYMVIEYKDGVHEYINLSEEVRKNSDGGYYVPLKLDTDLKVGQKFKLGDVLAYDKLSFSKSIGESGKLAANIGTLAKIAIINTDEGFEDSAAITESFANKLGTSVIQSVDSKIDKGSNIFIYKEIGDKVMEGDTLFAYQTDFDDDIANTLLKNLTMDVDQISELGRNPVKTKYTGIVENIEVYRTCELEDLSPSLKSFVTKHENKIKNIKSIYDKYNIDASVLPPTEKVPEIGKTKGLDNGVLIIYYIKYNDNMSIGDKITFYSANKGIIKYIISKEDEPYTDFRPNEHIDSFLSLSSVNGRMTGSLPLFAATCKLMVELDRSVKELAGIPYDESKL